MAKPSAQPSLCTHIRHWAGQVLGAGSAEMGPERRTGLQQKGTGLWRWGYQQRSRSGVLSREHHSDGSSTSGAEKAGTPCPARPGAAPASIPSPSPSFTLQSIQCHRWGPCGLSAFPLLCHPWISLLLSCLADGCSPEAILESFLVISTGCGQIGTLSQAR